jgi:hypothetical protein
MMKQNEDRSVACWKNIILIKPESSQVDYYEFHKLNEIVEDWYNCANFSKAIQTCRFLR